MEKYGKTAELLVNHFNKYPKMHMTDLFKYLYQSSFGCGHSVTDLEKVTEWVRREYSGVKEVGDDTPEELDGGFYRLPLSYLNGGMSAETLGKLFYLSAQKQYDGLSGLTKRLKIARNLMEEGRIKLSPEVFDKAHYDWCVEGYTAIHHSDRFRTEYNPAYRVISSEYIPYLPLLTAIDKGLKKGRVTLAIEGGSGSGKSTLGKMLKEIYGCTLFHTDDFFLQKHQRTAERFAEIGGNLDRERLESEVLIPLKKGEKLIYRPFDCSKMEVGEGREITPTELTVVEGAYSMHPDLEKYYHLSVFLEISESTQRERIINRNGEDFAKRFFNEWIPLEKVYFEKTKAKIRCNIQISVE